MLLGHPQHRLAGDAVQDVVADRAHPQFAVLDEEEARGSSLGHVAVRRDHQRLVGTGEMRRLLGHHLPQQIGGLDIAAGPADVRRGRQRDRLRRRVGGELFLLGKGKDRRLVLVVIEVASVARAARDLKIHEPLDGIVHFDQLHHRDKQLVARHRPRHVQLAKRPSEPVHMIFVIDDLGIEDAEALIDGISEQQAAVENRHRRLALRHEFAIQKHCPYHRPVLSLLETCCRRNKMKPSLLFQDLKTLPEAAGG